jgi:hypothetical protein
MLPRPIKTGDAINPTYTNPPHSGIFFVQTKGVTMHTFKIKIKTAAGVAHLHGIFPSKWAAVAAGMDALGEAEGNVVATEVTP